MLSKKSVSYKKGCNVVLKPSKHEKITFPKEFIFGFIPYFVGAIFSKNVKCGGSGKKIKRRVCTGDCL